MGEIGKAESGLDRFGRDLKGGGCIAVIAGHGDRCQLGLLHIGRQEFPPSRAFRPSLSSHSTVTRSRPLIAIHMFSATTASPREIRTTSTTPLRALAFAASKDLTVAPNFGGWIITAVAMPGNLTSMV